MAEQYEHGTLDRERSLWTHSTGATMDLTLPWRDCEGRRWWWTGDVHPVNGPWMAEVDGDAGEPLDVVLAMWGPLQQAGGEGR